MKERKKRQLLEFHVYFSMGDFLHFKQRIIAILKVKFPLVLLWLSCHYCISGVHLAKEMEKQQTQPPREQMLTHASDSYTVNVISSSSNKE